MDAIVDAGLPLIYRGKVRDTYKLQDPTKLLMVARNRVSIFDFVLPCSIPGKGKILTDLTVFWLTNVLSCTNHLVDWGTGIDGYLPKSLRGDAELQSQAMIVGRLEIFPAECIVRGYLTGSAWSEYQKNNGMVFGHQLPVGLFDGAKLPRPIFTPTTKACAGHDKPILLEEMENGVNFEKLSLEIYERAFKYAISRGIIIADTKFEFGKWYILADEVLTPDSSRFWDLRDWMQAVAEKRPPTNYDKQVIREWGKTVETPFKDGEGKAIIGIHKLNPENPEHLGFVQGLKVPEDVLEETSRRYQYIFERLTQ